MGKEMDLRTASESSYILLGFTEITYHSHPVNIYTQWSYQFLPRRIAPTLSVSDLMVENSYNSAVWCRLINNLEGFVTVCNGKDKKKVSLEWEELLLDCWFCPSSFYNLCDIETHLILLEPYTRGLTTNPTQHLPPPKWSSFWNVTMNMVNAFKHKPL